MINDKIIEMQTLLNLISNSCYDALYMNDVINALRFAIDIASGEQMPEEKDNDVVKEPSPLEIPTIKITEEQMLHGAYGWWDIVCAWCHTRAPDVLVQWGFKDRTWYIYFGKIEDYKDFVLNFPEVLRSPDDED